MGDALLTQVDSIEFASGDNAITSIPLRIGRGTLFEPYNKNYLNEEVVDLPTVIGGTNASGKTSMLIAIDEICKLLQQKTINEHDSGNLWKNLRKMNVRHIQIQFACEIGRSKHMHRSFFRHTNYEGKEKINLHTRNDGEIHDENANLVVENLVQIRMNSDNDAENLEWRNGFRLRRIGSDLDSSIESFYKQYAILGGKKNQNYRKIQKTETIAKFLKDNRGENIDGIILENYSMADLSDFELNFQSSHLIEVDRSKFEDDIGKIRNILPKITESFDLWKSNPLVLREHLFNHAKHNKLFSDLGLKSSDVLYFDPGLPGMHTLHDYAPDVIEKFMLQRLQSYTWYENCAWNKKQDALDMIIEGCIHDIVEYVTGHHNSSKVLIGEETNFSSGYANKMYINCKWVKTEDVGDNLVIWKDSGYPMLGNEKKKPPSPSEILTELPFLSNYIGIEIEDRETPDILSRFNTFTPIEKFDEPYFSSGQKQILSLITGVRRAPQNSLILIDEPEISLHVNWQEILIEQLNGSLISSRLLIATHSPDIMSRHVHLFYNLEGQDLEG